MKRGVCLLFAALLALTAAEAFAKAPAGSTAAAQLQFGTEMAQRGLWSEALFRFRQAERMEPENVRAINNIAVALEALGKFDDALVAYQRALKVDPSNVDVKRNYGRFAEFYQSFKGKAKPADPPPVVPKAAPGGSQ